MLSPAAAASPSVSIVPDGPARYAAPEPTYLPKREIERIAARTAQVSGFHAGGDLDGKGNLRAAVARMGGKISWLNWDQWWAHECDTIQVDGPGDFRICLLEADGPLRHRFTIAHELGHYVLHSRVGERRIEAGRKGSNRVEWEANWFAAALLMPEKRFRAAELEFRPADQKVLALSGRFLVSMEAAQIRLKTLGLPLS